MNTTSVYERLAAAWIGRKRHVWVEGGTAASKTYSILELLILIALYAKSPLLISVVSESVPHLKRGAMRDFQAIMGESWDPARWQKTDSTYSFGMGTIEFFSADQPSKLRGGRRDILFLNEANNLPHDAFRELDARTRLFTVCDWNPTNEFWYHEFYGVESPDSAYIHCTYKDALNVIPPEVVANILDMGSRDPNWENIYVNGFLGKIEGLVYPAFSQVDAMPIRGREFYGLDFGFSNDVTALVRERLDGDELTCEELIYERGMTNDDIAHRMVEVGVRKNYDEIFADAAEPKSIEEIHRHCFNIKSCPKGADSVEFGHQKVRQLKQRWTKGSLNAIKEQRNFRYIKDKDGKLTEKTTHAFSHAMDARRYGVVGATYSGPVSAPVVSGKNSRWRNGHADDD